MHEGLPKHIPADFMSAITHLDGKQRLELDDMKLLVVLETAGEPLYQKLASLAPDDESRELLLTNGREETAHAHRVKRAIEIMTGAPYEIPPMSENPYAEAPPFTALTPELLAGIQAGETNGDAGYQRYAEAEPNEEIAELYRQNGREEIRHGERVGRVAEILSSLG